jgi:hypothetical protein
MSVESKLGGDIGDAYIRQVLAGMIIYNSADIAATAQKFSAGYGELLAEGLPLELYTQQLAMITPHGKVFTASFMWASDDHETGKTVLAKIAGLGDSVLNTVAPTTIGAFMQFLKSVVPPNANGSIETISIRELTPEAATIIARNLEKMPSTYGTGFSMHELRGPSASPNAESVFGSREPHMMMEIIKTVADQKDLKGTEEWANSFIAELRKMDPRNILPGTYISLTPPGSNSFENIFGSNYRPLLEMKRMYDPEGIFQLAPPEVNVLK